MNANESVEADLDDGTDLTDLLERAERSLLSKDDDKYYVTRDEIFLLAAQPDLEREPRIELDCGGNWVIEIYYSKITFIHATSCQAFVRQIIQ